jgi:pyruvate dehydrogenase E1 component alpha subunit/2-oxoisovalerate dehydrogenase E1 component alpha subunit
VTLSSPIATQVPQAVGAAHAAKIRKDGAVVIAYMGDGATSEGDFHVAMTFAGQLHLPVVLFCANNQWAISVPWDKQTKSATIAVKARAYGIPGVRVDGNDALAVWEVTRQAVDKARRGDGPTFIEALTYRIGAHSTSDDPSRYRDESITEQWKQRDPITRLYAYLCELGLWSEEREAAFVAERDALIRKTVAEQETLAGPDVRSLFEDVYAEPPWHLREQQAELLRAMALNRTPSGGQHG